MSEGYRARRVQSQRPRDTESEIYRVRGIQSQRATESEVYRVRDLQSQRDTES